MRTRVESREFRRHVVRVDRADGSRALGTGFFVAPGWVLTCAHVVYDKRTGTQLDDVTVVPDVLLDAGSVPAAVVARSPSGRGTELWPFPDLALLRLDGWSAHPCVWLHPADPIEACHAWGFACRGDEISPAGSPASFRFEGVEGDGYLKLAAGQAAPGLSGAPLLCPVHRAVVGVVAATRDVGSDLGGWASPVAALLGGGPGVPDDLAAYGRQIAELNRATVLANRAGWHAVLPVDDAEQALAKPYATFVKKPRSSPADLLRADFAVVPYLFRDTDLDEAQTWCEQPDAIQIARIGAVGGAGKTRFAVELCRRMVERGWIAGTWTGADIADVARLALPRLVVIDYTEAVAVDALRNAISRLGNGASDLAPVRLLLLTRTSAGSTTDVFEEIGRHASAALRLILADAEDSSAARALTAEQRYALYTTALAEFGRAWQMNGRASKEISAEDLQGDKYELPLQVLFEAFDHALADGDPDTARPPVDRVLDHEERYWDATAPGSLPADLRRSAVALATLAGAADDDEAESLLCLLPDLASDHVEPVRQRTIAWLAGLYPGAGRLNPLRPDRLGEALIADVLRRQNDGGHSLLSAVIALPADEQVTACLDALARLSVTDPATATMTATILAAHHDYLVTRAEDQAHGTADQPGRLTLSNGLIRLLAGNLAERLAAAEPGTTSYARDLSISYNKLADLALGTGQSDQAERLYRQALTIGERLAAAEPGNTSYARDLSISYERLADLALGTGQSDQAERLYRQALTIAERLAAAEPGTTSYARDLSISYERLADLALGTGQSDQAERLYRQALTIAERLAAAEPGTTSYARDLSISYERLADLALGTGQSDQAERLYRQALTIRERLAAAEPGNTSYARDLSISYNKLADLALGTGQSDQAERLYRQALTIAERLAAAEPGNTSYARDLSISYERLADLALGTGQSDQAERLYRQALTIAERLAAAEPGNTSYARDLSISYNKLADLALGTGQSDQAERLYRQALTIAERLAAAEPGNTSYARDLSISYERLADLALGTGQSDQAERLYRQALTIRERLAAAEPGNTSYARDLSISYERLGDLARRADQFSEAAEWFTRAVDIRRVLYRQESRRVDLAEEFGVALRLLAGVCDQRAATQAKEEARSTLEPFERAATLTAKGASVLAWARL